MAKGKRKNEKKQQPVSQEIIRPVVKTDTWCSFKKRARIQMHHMVMWYNFQRKKSLTFYQKTY